MSATFDITPTAQDVAAARDMWASVVAEYHGLGVVDYSRYLRASTVAVELGVAMQGLVAVDESAARFAARARALFEEWVRP